MKDLENKNNELGQQHLRPKSAETQARVDAQVSAAPSGCANESVKYGHPYTFATHWNGCHISNQLFELDWTLTGGIGLQLFGVPPHCLVRLVSTEERQCPQIPQSHVQSIRELQNHLDFYNKDQLFVPLSVILGDGREMIGLWIRRDNGALTPQFLDPEKVQAPCLGLGADFVDRNNPNQPAHESSKASPQETVSTISHISGGGPSQCQESGALDSSFTDLHNDLAQRRLREEKVGNASGVDAQTSVAASCYGDFWPPEFSSFMPMGWGGHLYVQWLSKTNNQPHVYSLSKYLAAILEIHTVIEGSLSLSHTECHFRRVARALQIHAPKPGLGILMKELENSCFAPLLEFVRAYPNTDTEKFASQTARDFFQRCAEQRKVRIPFCPNWFHFEIDSLEVPVIPQISEQAREPSESSYSLLTVDVDRGSFEDSLRNLWVKSHNELGQQHLRPQTTEASASADAQVSAAPSGYGSSLFS